MQGQQHDVVKTAEPKKNILSKDASNFNRLNSDENSDSTTKTLEAAPAPGEEPAP